MRQICLSRVFASKNLLAGQTLSSLRRTLCLTRWQSRTCQTTRTYQRTQMVGIHTTSMAWQSQTHGWTSAMIAFHQNQTPQTYMSRTSIVTAPTVYRWVVSDNTLGSRTISAMPLWRMLLCSTPRWVPNHSYSALPTSITAPTLCSLVSNRVRICEHEFCTRLWWRVSWYFGYARLWTPTDRRGAEPRGHDYSCQHEKSLVQVRSSFLQNLLRI